MLLENFAAAYLDGVAKKIEEYSNKYRELYTKCYEQLEAKAKSSIQSNILRGLTNANYIAAVAMEKVRVIEKTQLDESLLRFADKLDNISSDRIEQTMAMLIEKQSCCVQPFIENVQAVNKLYNEPIELLFDKENIYLKELA